MNKFCHIFLSLVMLIGLSVAVSAQRGNDPKRPPPKERPPKVEPGPEKPPPRERPKDDKKKPGSGFAHIWRHDEKNLA